VTESSTGSTSVGDVAKPDAELHARWPLQPLPSLSIRNVLLAVIVVVQLCTAIVGIDWGLPYLWNSDEKIDPVAQMLWQHTLDPHYFVNPTLAIYEVLAVARISYALHPRKVVEISLRHIVPLTWVNHPVREAQFLTMRMIRAASALLAVATLLVVYRIGRRHFGDAEALFAAAYFSVSMGIPNMAHFATVEPMLLLMIVCALASYSRIVESGAARDYVLAGSFTGLACSTKYTAVMLAVPFVISHVGGRGLAGSVSARGWRLLALAVLTALAAFCAASPYAIIRFSQFWNDGIKATFFMGAPNGTMIGLRRSWIPYFWLLVDGLGVPLLIVGIGGVAAAVARWRSDERARQVYLVHRVWVLAFYGFYGLSPHHALRFIMPIVPSLALLGGRGLDGSDSACRHARAAARHRDGDRSRARLFRALLRARGLDVPARQPLRGGRLVAKRGAGRTERRRVLCAGNLPAVLRSAAVPLPLQSGRRRHERPRRALSPAHRVLHRRVGPHLRGQRLLLLALLRRG